LQKNLIFTSLRTRMESVAAAWTRLHFQSFGTTAGLHNCESKARLVHAFYWSSGVDHITKNGVSKKKGHALWLHACKCEKKHKSF